jgi:hypothetical protein
MEYWYTDRDKGGIYYSGWDAGNVYEGYRKAHLNPKSCKYGAVLMSTKRVFTGWEFKLKIFFRSHWYWKPEFRWKYGQRYFHWLFFMTWIEPCYNTVMDKVVKDHLNEV